MRTGRIIVWIISLAIFVSILYFQKQEESKIPYEERTEIKVYCLQEYQKSVKNIIEDSNMGKSHRVVFTDNKEEAELILTDTITTLDSRYEKIGWTPLVVAFDDTTKDKQENYLTAGYLEEVGKDSTTYRINFQKVIEDTLKGTFTDKIYCPKSGTREGELFFDFLLVNINAGKYPKNDKEMEECSKKANEFLNRNIVFQVDSTETLRNKLTVTNEIFVVFEKDIYYMDSTAYDFEISYPINTVLYECYYYLQGNNEMKLKEMVNKDNGLQKLIGGYGLRNNGHILAYDLTYYSESDGFTYVEIPLKEE